MDKPENWISCGVCGEKTRFCYLKVQLCRACASFYRRAVTESIKYECQFEDRCKLDYRRRNICPSCRFSKCRQMGAILKREKRQQQLEASESFANNNQHVIEAQNEDSLSSAVSTIQSNCLFFNESILNNLVMGYNWYLEEERRLHILRHPEFDFNNGKSMLVKNRKIPIQMEIDCLPLVFSMFNDYYRAFSGFQTSQKIKLTASIAYEICHMHKAFLTSQNYQSINDRRMSMTNGYYVYHNRIDIGGYMYGLFMSKELEDFINVYQPISTRRYNNFRKFKQLGLGKQDAVCMMFLVLCRYIEYMGLFTDEFERLRERVINEWYSKIKEECGIAEAPQKFAKIFSYYLETNTLNNDFVKLLILLGLKNNRPDIVPIHDTYGCTQKLCEKLGTQID